MKALLIAFVLVSCAHAYDKQWARNTDFDNADNWDVGRKSCPADTIHMPEETSVFLQTNNSIKQMILPSNGFLILSESIVLSFSDTQNDDGCTGEDVYFADSDGRDWFAPDNWNSEENIPLETERVPCYWDHVTFPQDNSFKVRLDENVTVHSLTFDGKDYSTEEFAEFLRTDFGHTQFVHDNEDAHPSVQITNLPCLDEAGCVCGNDMMFREKICELANCEAMLCSSALTPNGSCCQLCGATVTMDYLHGQFILTDFEQAVDELLQRPSSNRTKRSLVSVDEDEVMVSIYVSRTSSDKIQMVVTDNETGYQSGNSAGDTADFIAQDIQQNMEKYGVTNVKVERSSEGTPTPIPGNSRTLSGGGVAGIVIGILCACALAFAIVLFVRKRPGESWDLPSMPTMPWNRNRWQEENMVTFNQSNGRHRSGSAEAGVVGFGFDNPIYDSQRSSQEGSNGSGRLSAYQTAAQFMQMDMDTSFSNPVYTGEVTGENDDPFTAFDTVDTVKIETEGDDTITGFSNPATVDISLEDDDNEVDIVEA